MKDGMIGSMQDLCQMVNELGFLPFFANKVPGFSIEEHILPELWFSDEAEGPWEWKGPVIRETGCAYGKFFRNKAGFISKEWFPDFANMRRDGYDFDALFDDGLARTSDKAVYDVLDRYPSLVSRHWRKLTGISKRGAFDSIITRLQMGGYLTTIDFEYAHTRKGETYGWGLARYATPEKAWGEAFTEKVYLYTPEESRKRIEDHLRMILPNITQNQLDYLLK